MGIGCDCAVNLARGACASVAIEGCMALHHRPILSLLFVSSW